jgi:GH24 family phage-related lysozyme (muramidase)
MGRRRACEGKVKHASVGGAIAHAKSMARSGKGTGLNPYRCQHCNGWHIGRGEAGRLASLNQAFARLASKDGPADPCG